MATLADTDDAVLGPMLSTVLPGSGKRLRPALALLIGRMARARSRSRRARTTWPSASSCCTPRAWSTTTSSTNRTRAMAAPRCTRASATRWPCWSATTCFLRPPRSASRPAICEVVRLFAETLGAMAQGQIDDAKRQLGGRARWADAEPRALLPHHQRARPPRCSCWRARAPAQLAGLTTAQVAGAARVRSAASAWRSRWSTTSWTSPAPSRSWASRSAATCARATITLPVILMRERQLADGTVPRGVRVRGRRPQVRLVQESGAIAAAYAEAEELVRAGARGARGAARGYRARRARRAGALRHPRAIAERRLAASGRGTCAAGG